MPSLQPQVALQVETQDRLLDDVTVVMPVVDRLKYFRHYLGEGFWDGLNLSIVCDGSTEEVIEQIQALVEKRKSTHIFQHDQNYGIARSRSTGIQRTETPCIAFCDDDDFMTEARSFLEWSRQTLAQDPDCLCTLMPEVFSFDEELGMRLQYDRKEFDGRLGLEVLRFLVLTGEMRVFSLGALFRTSDLRGLEPEDLFRVSEDYVFVARLCARYPERKVAVAPMGQYMRLMQADSLSSRQHYSLEKIVMHLVSMVVGAYYLMQRDELTVEGLQQILRRRGQVLKQSYGKGDEAADAIALMLKGERPAAESSEQFRARTFLDETRQLHPAEFVHLTSGQALR